MTEETPIAELMARNPLLLSDLNLDEIVTDLRKSRFRFDQAGDKKIGTPAARKSVAQKDREARAKVLNVTSLDDLFKDL